MQPRTRLYCAVGVGGAIGSVARYLISLATLVLAGPGFPWGTIGVNVLGSFLIGLYFALTEPEGRLMVGPARRQFVLAGFCGGFTTFSIFSLESLLLVRQSAWVLAGVYIGVSVLLWLTAVWLGHAIGDRINRLPGRRG